ncbi:MAG TPA: PepSY domain-containing protein [Phycisphaerales bacterium]|nr:PepSY domain-containing protein [Phycisphaerales bacterium]
MGNHAADLPLLLVVCTGILLLLKKEITWIQPPTLRGAGGEPAINLGDVLEVARTVSPAEVESWGDISRLDVRVKEGVIKVQARGGWEIQVCASTGALLGHAVRRSDLIEAIHDGSWFGNVAKMGIFLPSAVLVLALWVTGVWLWLRPYLARRDAVAPRSIKAGPVTPPGP